MDAVGQVGALRTGRLMLGLRCCQHLPAGMRESAGIDCLRRSSRATWWMGGRPLHSAPAPLAPAPTVYPSQPGILPPPPRQCLAALATRQPPRNLCAQLLQDAGAVLIPSLMDLADAFNNGNMTLNKLVGNMQVRAVLAPAVHAAAALQRHP